MRVVDLRLAVASEPQPPVRVRLARRSVLLSAGEVRIFFFLVRPCPEAFRSLTGVDNHRRSCFRAVGALQRGLLAFQQGSNRGQKCRSEG